mgnify:CR=1 FL=1
MLSKLFGFFRLKDSSYINGFKGVFNWEQQEEEEVSEDGAYIILDDHGTVVWSCRTDGASGEQHNHDD